MSSVFFRTVHARFDASALRGLLTPRKPRNALLRIALGLLGVALLAVLLVVGLFVGAAMLLFGLMRRMLRKPVRPVAQADALDAEYRVVPKHRQHALR